ncbi:MAG: hypothetical protein PVF63_05560, partial [Gammaproteobacteria bacterium]
MSIKRSRLLIAAALACLMLVLAVAQFRLQDLANAQSADQVMAPAFEVDPFWPKPLPNHWILGMTIGVAVDSRDHVFIVHRDQQENFNARTEIGLASGVSECCTPAPPILEFDRDGNLINAWGDSGGTGNGYVWPASNHGIEVDAMGNVWIGGNGMGDSHILKFSGDGTFLQQIGEPGNMPDSNSRTHFSRVAEIAIDASANEAYIADGYGNKRVAVLDVDTGAFKRYWGAYGNRPDDAENAYDP